MTTYANPFRIAVESFDTHPELTPGQRAFWFDSFWEEWDDSTHDGNSIFEMFNDQLDHTEEVVDYENRIAWINEIALDGDSNDDPNVVWASVDHVARVERQRALMLIAAEIVDRTWEVYPEMKEAVTSSRDWRDALNNLHLDRPWESISLDFELGTESTHFERIVRALFSVDMGVVK